MRRFYPLTVLLLSGACHRSEPAQRPFERAGHGLDTAADKTGRALTTAAQKTGKAVTKAGSATGKAFSKVGTKLQGKGAAAAPASPAR
jgi:hypothetical protein